MLDTPLQPPVPVSDLANLLVDPVGAVVKPEVDAPRPGPLSGLTLGLLDNTKWNAATLLSMVAEEIRLQVPLNEVRVYRKPTWGQPISEDLRRTIAEECQAVVTASGD